MYTLWTWRIAAKLAGHTLPPDAAPAYAGWHTEQMNREPSQLLGVTREDWANHNGPFTRGK